MGANGKNRKGQMTTYSSERVSYVRSITSVCVCVCVIGVISPPRNIYFVVHRQSVFFSMNVHAQVCQCLGCFCVFMCSVLCVCVCSVCVCVCMCEDQSSYRLL